MKTLRLDSRILDEVKAVTGDRTYSGAVQRALTGYLRARRGPKQLEMASADRLNRPAAGLKEKPRWTALQGQYLAFIHAYRTVHGVAPSERDMQRRFRVSPPSVHRMVVALDEHNLIRRTPGQARSIELLVDPKELPPLMRPSP